MRWQRVEGGWHAFWRGRGRLYYAGGAPIRGALFVTPGGRTVAAQDTELGQEIDLTLQYTINRQASLTVGYSRFFAGDFLNETGTSEDTDFVYTQFEITF